MKWRAIVACRWWQPVAVGCVLGCWLRRAEDYDLLPTTRAGDPLSPLTPRASDATLPTGNQVEGMLRPLEGRCFAYRPAATEDTGIGTGRKATTWTFQWCHKGRATVRLEGGSRIPQQIDLGTSEETIIGPAIVPAGEQRQRQRRQQQLQQGFLPAVSQRFTGGSRCPQPATTLGGADTCGARDAAAAAFADEREKGKENGGTRWKREEEAAGGPSGGGAVAVGARREWQLTVSLWCCDSAGGGEGGDKGDATIVNLEIAGAGNVWGGEGGGGRDDGGDGGGGDDGGEAGDRKDCPKLVASICTHLLCPAYPEFADEPRDGGGGDDEREGRGERPETTKSRGVSLEGAHYETPQPKPFVSRRQRGFVDYDRRQPMRRSEQIRLREEVREMFVHSYDGYMRHAFPGGELSPLSCESGELHLVKVPLVTLVDTLDTLAIMGNATEFRRAVRLVSDGLDVEADVDVSVFESNIRLLGGLLSAHLLATDAALDLYPDERVEKKYGTASSAAGGAGTVSASSSKRVVEAPAALGAAAPEAPISGAAAAAPGALALDPRPPAPQRTSSGPSSSFCSRSSAEGDLVGDANSRVGGGRWLGDSDADGSAHGGTAAAATAAAAAGTGGGGKGGQRFDGGGEVMAVEAEAEAEARVEEGTKGRDRWTGDNDEVEREEGGGGGSEKGEQYDGELLVLAERLGRRLLPAFATPTGIPYGTVNLKTGVPEGETTEASLAGAGSLSLEFSVLSALTGDGVFAEAAEGAVKALFHRRSAGLGLVGKHIDTKTGRWTETESGIGTNGDSFYEYLLKMYILWGDVEYWDMFMKCYLNVQRFVREGDWYAGVDMDAGFVSARTFDNLMAFWPGMQTLVGDVTLASRTLNAMFLVWRDLGFLPEQFNHEKWTLHDEGVGRAYPLRPELIESTLLLRRATGDPSWLWAGKDFLGSLQMFCRTECGYAGVRDVGDCSLDEQMPSFFLSETLKYLYLLFDENNFLHSGNYVFSTEAHPFSVEVVRRGGHSAAAAGDNGCGAHRDSYSVGQNGGDANPAEGTGVTAQNAENAQQGNYQQQQQQQQQQRQQQRQRPRRGQREEKTSDGKNPERKRRRWWWWWQRKNRHGRSSPMSPAPAPTPAPAPAPGSTDGLSSQAGTSIARNSGGDVGGGGDVSGDFTGAACGFASWGAWRASVGEEHPLGPDGWRDSNIFYWAQEPEPEAEGQEEGILAIIVEEMRYMGALWRMYMDRVCPVPPWWQAPHPYSPTNFTDTLVGGGRTAWLSILAPGDKAAGSQTESGGAVTQLISLDGIGVIEVTAYGSNTFVARHQDTGETLEISQVVVPGGGFGVPGDADAGAMHISSYRQPRPPQQTQPSLSPASTPSSSGKTGTRGQSVGEATTAGGSSAQLQRHRRRHRLAQDAKADGEEQKGHNKPKGIEAEGMESKRASEAPAARRLANIVTNWRRDVQDKERKVEEMMQNLAVAQEAAAQRPPQKEAGTVAGDSGRRLSRRIQRAKKLRLVALEKALLISETELIQAQIELEKAKTAAILAELGASPRVEGDGEAIAGHEEAEEGEGEERGEEQGEESAEEEEAGQEEEGAATGEGLPPSSSAAPEEGRGKATRKRHTQNIRRHQLSRKTITVTKEGLSVYCWVYVAGIDRPFPCSLSTFSAPGNGLATTPPIATALHITGNPGSPGEISLGCRSLDEDDSGGGGHGDGDGDGDDSDGGDDIDFAAVDASAAAASATAAAPGDAAAAASEIAFIERRQRWVRRVRHELSEAGDSDACAAPTTAALDADRQAVGAKRDHSGSIFVVSRGECTFERKAIIAQAAGAVGVVVINNEPGGVTFPMPGASKDGESGVNIPVVMVGMEDGLEILRAASVSEAAEAAVEVQGVIDARTLHQTVLSRLIREQRSGLRDMWGSLLDERSPAKYASSASGTSGGAAAVGSSAATTAKTGIGAGSEGAAGEEQREDWAEGMGKSSSSSSSSSGGTHGKSNSEGNPFPFLASGFDEATLGGMRPPPFLLPTVITGDGYVQVMGMGHWAVVLAAHNGAWVMSLAPNLYNPPPRHHQAANTGTDMASEAASAADQGDLDDGEHWL